VRGNALVRRGRIALIGGLVVAALLLLPAGASALQWGQWVKAEYVTETSATIELYIHPLWPETHWEVVVFSETCGREPERCDENFDTSETGPTGTIIQKSPYEIVEIDVTIPGLLYEEPLQPTKLYGVGLATSGKGERTGAVVAPSGGADNSYPYPSFETPGVRGPEEQHHIATIEKERGKREKKAWKTESEWINAERKLARDKEKSEKG
jgi:hypothetical protein